MPGTVVPNAAYFVGASSLEIETDNFTAAVNSVKLTPKTPSSAFTDIGGGVQTFVGATEWVLEIGYAQDWTTPESLSYKLLNAAGMLKTCKITPVTGGVGVTVSARLQPGAVGGKAGSVAEDTVQLPVTGQPVWEPIV